MGRRFHDQGAVDDLGDADPAFQAELDRLERMVERQRRQIERDLASER